MIQTTRGEGEPIKSVEQELRLQRGILEARNESGIDGFFVISPDLRIELWNERLLDMWRVPEELMNTRDWTSLLQHIAGLTSDPEGYMQAARAVAGDEAETRRDEISLADGRVFDRWTAPVRMSDGTIHGRLVSFLDITVQKRLEERLRADEKWSAFLAESTSVLSHSLDLDTVLSDLAKLVVGSLADWCFFHQIDAKGALVPSAIGHKDPRKVAALKAYLEAYPADPGGVGTGTAIRTRAPVLLEEIDDDVLVQAAKDPDELRALREFGFRSGVIVPIICRGNVLGALTLAVDDISRKFTRADIPRVRELAERVAYPIDNARLHAQTIDVTRTLQKSFLPPDLPDIPGTDISARYFPAGEGELIGGDFYDAFRVHQRRWGLALGDVSGKGLDAATVTALVRHTIRGAALTANSPSDTLRLLNQAMLEQNETDRFCTAVYAIVEPRFGRVRVTVSSGGHPYPYVIRNDGTVEELACGGTLLGFIEEVSLRDVSVELEFGDKLFLYTDGVLDIRRKHGMFGPVGLENLLHECAKRGTEAAADHISTTLADLQDGHATDDIAFILMGVRSSIFNIQSRRGRGATTRGGLPPG